jgi:hypothetical protein
MLTKFHRSTGYGDAQLALLACAGQHPLTRCMSMSLGCFTWCTDVAEEHYNILDRLAPATLLNASIIMHIFHTSNLDGTTSIKASIHWSAVQGARRMTPNHQLLVRTNGRCRTNTPLA